jgi:hypothetical protein
MHSFTSTYAFQRTRLRTTPLTSCIKNHVFVKFFYVNHLSPLSTVLCQPPVPTRHRLSPLRAENRVILRLKKADSVNLRAGAVTRFWTADCLFNQDGSPVLPGRIDPIYEYRLSLPAVARNHFAGRIHRSEPAALNHFALQNKFAAGIK